ncbi:MAG: hypothetical protein AB7E42_00260 [Anaerotignaceae bacterium]
MKKHVKLAVTAVAICVLSLSLAGCSGSSTTTTAATPATEEKAEAPAEQTGKDVEAKEAEGIYGKITAVSGTEVTLALGTMDMVKGEAPTGEAPTGEAPTGEAPTGEAPMGEAPTGEAPQGGDMGNGKNESSFTASDEEINTEIDSSVTIKVVQDGKLVEGTIEDLTVDTVVKITYDGEDKIIELQVMGGNATDKKEK